jgi:hypothetical protein
MRGRVMVDEILAQLSRRFDGMYARAGRPSIPPEKLLRAQFASDAVIDLQRAAADASSALVLPPDELKLAGLFSVCE